MEQLHFITKLLDIKDPNIQIMDVINRDTHKEIIAKPVSYTHLDVYKRQIQYTRVRHFPFLVENHRYLKINQ